MVNKKKKNKKKKKQNFQWLTKNSKCLYEIKKKKRKF